MARAVLLVALLIGCGRFGFDATDDGGSDTPLPAGRWAKVSVTFNSACGITTGGELWCWGQSFDGQLGTGDIAAAVEPRRVGTASDWVDIEIDFVHACGLRADRTLWCWGWNGSGALGTGIMDQKYPTPQQVSPGALWKVLATGASSSCAIRDDDSLWCWGEASNGQLGGGSTTDQPRPVLMNPMVSRTTLAVELGNATACAIDDLGALHCWGASGEGQVGNGSRTDSTVPVAIAPGSTWLALAGGGQHMCALQMGGVAWCWGRNYEGEVGDGSVTRRTVPTRVAGVPPFVQLATGDLHTCGLTADGEVWCWGDAMRGRIAGVDATDVRVPQRVSAPRATFLAAGGRTTCVIDDAAHLFCTGANGSGQASGLAGEVHTLQRADDRTDWKAIYAHSTHACGRLTDDRVMCWGRGNLGELGDGARLDRQAPVAAGTMAFDHLEVGGGTTVGLAGTNAYVWGYDIMTDTLASTPTQRGMATSLAIGIDHACYTAPGGSLFCRGDNSSGQLGDGTTMNATSDVMIPGTWSFVVAWNQMTCGVVSGTGTLRCWGEGPRTGTNNTGPVTTPTNVVGIPAPVTRVELRTTGGCALAGAGELWCWGDNDAGVIGDGSSTNRPTAVRVGTRTDWRVVDLGDRHACATAADGTLWCWGHDDQGQHGRPQLLSASSPTQVGTDTDWADVASGDHFTCALKTGGTRWCFGANDYGELGNGRSWLTAFTVVP